MHTLVCVCGVRCAALLLLFVSVSRFGFRLLVVASVIAHRASSSILHMREVKKKNSKQMRIEIIIHCVGFEIEINNENENEMKVGFSCLLYVYNIPIISYYYNRLYRRISLRIIDFCIFCFVSISDIWPSSIRK